MYNSDQIDEVHSDNAFSSLQCANGRIYSDDLSNT